MATPRYDIFFARIIVNNNQPAKDHNVAIPRYDTFFARIIVNSSQPAKNHNVGCVSLRYYSLTLIEAVPRYVFSPADCYLQ